MRRVPYPQQSMSPSQARLPAPSARFLIGLFALGSILGIALSQLEAPLWVFCIAPVLALPLLLRELRTLSPRAKKRLTPWPGRYWRSFVGGNHLLPSLYLKSEMRADSYRKYGPSAASRTGITPVLVVLVALVAIGVLVVVSPDSPGINWILLGLCISCVLWVVFRSVRRAVVFLLSALAVISDMSERQIRRRGRVQRRSKRDAQFENDLPPEDDVEETEPAAGRAGQDNEERP